MWNDCLLRNYHPFLNRHVLGGFDTTDIETHRTLYAGPDPALPGRILIRKLVRVADQTFCYEETRIQRVENASPTVHTQIYRLKGFDLDEKVDAYELTMRGAHRPLPNVLGFSVYLRHLPLGNKEWFSLVENTLYKTGGTWFEWF